MRRAEQLTIEQEVSTLREGVQTLREDMDRTFEREFAALQADVRRTQEVLATALTWIASTAGAPLTGDEVVKLLKMLDGNRTT